MFAKDIVDKVSQDFGTPDEVDLGVNVSKIATLDATKVSTGFFGQRPIPITNTTMLGAFCKTTELVKLESLFEPIQESFTGKIGKMNIKIAKRGYEEVKVKEF